MLLYMETRRGDTPPGTLCTSRGDSHGNMNNLVLLDVDVHIQPIHQHARTHVGDSWCITSGFNSLQTLPNNTHTQRDSRAPTLVFWSVALQSDG